ncbi:MAG: BamA/TamA family outer membrane protein, partial [Deltaproteobacteria bacterium]|nr:BamA/TamA family outer membrane protein [Deltaproteobacteria bacterium]
VKGFEFEGNNSYSHQTLSDVIMTYIEEVFPQESAFEQVKYQEMEYGLLYSDISTKDRYQHRVSVEQDRTKLLTGEYLHTNSALENFYKSNGYLSVEIGEPEMVFNDTKSQVILRYRIKEGVQTIVKKISFENNKSLSSFILSMNTRGLRNKPLSYFELENASLGIRRMYENEGYYFVSVDYDVDFSEDRKTANISFLIDENPKVYVKRIIPQGNYITNDSVILSNIFLKERGLLRQSDLVSSQARLLRLSVFQDASLSVLEPEFVMPEKDVLVQVRENEPRYIEYSLGLSTEEGIRTTFIFNHLNLFRSALEFNSRLTLSYQVFMYIPGYYDDSVAAAYKDLVLTDAVSRYVNMGLNYPKIYGIPLMASTRLDVINERVNQRAYYMDRSALSPSFEIQTLKFLSLYLQLSLDYKYLKRTPAVIPDSALSYSELQALRTPLGSNILGSVKPTITYDRRDDKFNPHRGYYLTFGSEYVQNLGSKPVSLLKLNSVNTVYIPTSRKNTLALQVSGGNIFSLSDDSQTPSDMFFYLGGRSTLRGIAEGALWPSDISDESKIEGGEIKLSPGGNTYLLYKIEFRFPLTRGFDGGLFLDAGNLWVNADNFSFIHLRATTGFGLRYRTPVGPIALDIGFNLMPDEAVSEPVMAWHFSVGLF